MDNSSAKREYDPAPNIIKIKDLGDDVTVDETLPPNFNSANETLIPDFNAEIKTEPDEDVTLDSTLNHHSNVSTSTNVSTSNFYTISGLSGAIILPP